MAFERVEHPAIADWITRFIAAAQWTGFIAFDIIVDEAGQPWGIECNPRTTSGLHFWQRADIARERQALIDTPEAEEQELASIYESRGLSKETAALVARELTAKDALGAHVRDELGLSEVQAANPLQAAAASGLTFTVAAALPVAAAVLAPEGQIIPTVVVATLVCLAGLGALGAKAGGAPLAPATMRVLFWGAAAMAITAGVGRIFGVSV